MKIGNQFYLQIQLEDEKDNILDISSVKKVQFTIDDLIKIYDGETENVTYDETNNCFKIWLTEDETFKFPSMVKMEARILFKNDTIGGTYIEQYQWEDSLKKEVLDV